ncbi:MAG: tRNA (adenosine(37)-N6)-threonylcarbamoyltransferase complex ATPase subunit type 1 TsaE [Thermoleophilaceae bacterium]|nr:tRNA (adenosine(37)-N6)-threonylcarbamoyltransferase complex ATPase subunit type 1 TsaE [Thermoleophilaceae bacterium]
MKAVSITETFNTASPDETAEIATSFAERLSPGDIVVLQGELGSGKTVFVRGAAHALGFAGRVTSPTFAIGNVYSGDRAEIAHLDLYRLGEIDVGDEAVLDDFLTPERIAFVEWPHDELADAERLRAVIALEHAGEDQRSIEIRWMGEQP